MSAKSRKRDDIQILRAIAVASVVVFHLDPDWMPGGYLGVDVFFVISGFLITGIVVKSLDSGSFSLSHFFLRRIKRLFPALAFALLSFTLLAIAFLPPLPFKGFMQQLPFAALQVSNFSFMKGAGYFDQNHSENALLHTWSLGVEEQFYLVWAPALLLLFHVHRRNSASRGDHFRPWKIVVTILVLSLLAEVATRRFFGDTVNFFSPLSRGWEFAMGALAFFMQRGFGRQIAASLLSSLGWIGILISLPLLTADHAANPLLRAIPCLATCLVLLHPEKGMHRLPFFLRKPVTYLGDISYSLYLWHWPFICFAAYLLNNHAPASCLPWSMALMFAGAIASYHLVELPLHYDRNWKRLLSWKSATACSALAIIAGAGFALRSEDEAAWRFSSPPSLPEAENYREPSQFPEIAARSSNSDAPYVRAQKAEAVLVGDSHARHFAPAVERWAEEKGLTCFTFYRNNFFALLDDTIDRNAGRKAEEDRRIAMRLRSHLLESENLKVVFLAQRTAIYLQSRPHRRENYSNSLEAFINPLAEKGIVVVLLGQAAPLAREPKPGPSLGDRMLRRDWHERDILLGGEITPVLELERGAYERAAHREGVYYFPTHLHIPNPYDSDDLLLYADDNHLNFNGSFRLYPALKALLSPIEAKGER
ncbi:MAG: acyltransferase [Verrucomicrobiae bacterium]|nr:acyltransferase [Verrucomicrobiae bacterium]